MEMTLKISAVALDCDDIGALIGFYSRVTGIPVFFQSEEFACLNMTWYWLTTHHVDGYVTPTWPEATTPKQFHLDLSASDLDAAEQFVLKCGAVKSEHQPSPDGSWRVFLDPAGHAFCLSTNIPDPATA